MKQLPFLHLIFPRAAKRIKFLKILQFKISHNRRVLDKYVSILKADKNSSKIKKEKKSFKIIYIYIYILFTNISNWNKKDRAISEIIAPICNEKPRVELKIGAAEENTNNKLNIIAKNMCVCVVSGRGVNGAEPRERAGLYLNIHRA